MAADPLVSKGARLERAAVLAYLRRKVRHTNAVADGHSGARVLSECVEWMLKRVHRYGSKKGGLGK